MYQVYLSPGTLRISKPTVHVASKNIKLAPTIPSEVFLIDYRVDKQAFHVSWVHGAGWNRCCFVLFGRAWHSPPHCQERQTELDTLFFRVSLFGERLGVGGWRLESHLRRADGGMSALRQRAQNSPPPAMTPR